MQSARTVPLRLCPRPPGFSVRATHWYTFIRVNTVTAHQQRSQLQRIDPARRGSGLTVSVTVIEAWHQSDRRDTRHETRDTARCQCVRVCGVAHERRS